MQVTHETCPHCGHHDCYSYNTELNVFRCFSCEKSGFLDQSSGNYEQEEDDLSDAYTPQEYRGISKSVLEKYGVYFTERDGKEQVHFPYPNGTKHRTLPKTIVNSGKMDHLFLSDYWNAGERDTITITEGEEDALSVIQMMGDYPVVSVPGATPSRDFWTNAREYLSGFQKIKLSVDNDEAGNALAQKFYNMFPGKCYRVAHTIHKDANAFLVNGDSKEYKASWWNAALIKPETILCSKEDFLGVYNDTPEYDVFPTGVKELDDKIMGIHKGYFTVILAPTGIGKCLAPETPVLRYDGKVVRADEVQVGDQLMGPDSKPRNVTNVNFQTGPMYRVTPVKGEPFECNADHILSLRNTTTGEIKNVVLTDYLDWSKTQKHLWKLWRSGPVQFNTLGTNNPEFAYAVGAYLGDGAKHDPKIYLGKPKEPVMEYLLSTGQIKTLKVKFKGGCYHLSFSKKDKLWDYLYSRGCLKTQRFVPEEMKTDTILVRSYVLAGLLDTDGSVTNGGAEITQKSEKLADDICFVSRSLGLAAYKKVKEVNGESYYRVTISGDLTFLPTQRLKFKEREQIKNVLNTGLTVEHIGHGTYRGIALDGDHLFLLGDFTVTHNTQFMRYLEHKAIEAGKKIAICHLEETKLTSLLGIVSYQLEDNLTRKDLIQDKGREADVKNALEELAQSEQLYQFFLPANASYEDLISQIRYLSEGIGVDYIFFEPMQDVIMGNVADKESQLTDLTNQLKRLAPELNVGIVTIAHANEDGDAKYCRSIVQGAGFEIGLSRDLDSEVEEIRNTMQIRVGRKNRTGGGSGPAGELVFDNTTYMLTVPHTPSVEIKDEGVGF